MFSHAAYLLALLGALGCLGAIDHRWRLVLWRDRRAGLLSIGLGVVFFAVWDLAGIRLDIFYAGHPAWVSGIELLPNFPVEELFFLTMLCYLPLLLWEARINRV